MLNYIEAERFLSRMGHETEYEFELRRRIALFLVGEGMPQICAQSLSCCVVNTIFYGVSYGQEVDSLVELLKEESKRK